MKKIAVKTLLVILTFTFAKCIPEPLDVNGVPIMKPEIVVSTQIIPDGSLAVLLTRTFSALGANEESNAEQVLRQIAVNDAIVVLKSVASVDTLQFLGNGVYGAIQIDFESGSLYTLEVTSASLGSVSATTEVLHNAKFRDVSTAIVYDASLADTIAHIAYDIVDAPGKNWLILNVVKLNRQELIDNVLDPREFTLAIEDTTEENGAYAGVIRLSDRFNPNDTVAVYVSNVSKEYYDFVKLRRDSRYSFVEYLSEPMNYNSNVRDGRGFFNLYVPDIEIKTLE